MPFLGEIAGLATAVCWSVTSILFTFVVRRIGSFTLNLARLTIASVILFALSLIFFGSHWLVTTSPQRLLCLIFSGWIGLTLGDWAYFQAMRMLGARMATLTMALAPPFTALLAIFTLRELPGLREILGMALTIAGVTWVVLEWSGEAAPRGHRMRGVLLGVLGSVGQAVGLILSKAGMAGGLDPMPSSAIRLCAGCLGAWLLALLTGQATGWGILFRTRAIQLAVLAASVLGPVLGIWLSLVSVNHTQAGVAATLMSTVPVLVLPLVVWVHKERVSPRAVLGAVLAVAGIAVLFLKK